MKGNTKVYVALAAVIGLAIGVTGAALGLGASSEGNLASIAESRGLSGSEAEAALATYVAPGQHDDYFLFASGGHSGQIHVIGVPSMRLLKTVPVFSPDAWSGYGFGADWSMELFDEGSNPEFNNPLAWGDTHHPALSETAGDYDGRYLYINDRANGRLAMVDLRDFKTKQIIDLPNMASSHGGVFATPNTEYVHIASKTPTTVFGTGDYHSALDNYADRFRGVSMFVSIDQATGRGVMDQSFQIELPPYNQDLADSGKLASEGWAFINSYNTEMATGGNQEGNPSLEAGAIANDYDYLHIINWKKAEQVIADGKFEMVDGVRMIRLDTAIAEGLLYFAAEPRNPHGVDVSPTGDYIVVSGKLDPNATVYSIEKIQAAIAANDIEGHDPFGVPVLRFDAVVEAQVELGAGPLHTQFDDKGNAYTSLFVESGVARWTLGTKAGVAAGDAFKLVDKIDVHYNIGHLVTAHGDTVNPHGKYMVALNKWSVDRFAGVGTLHPQNFQLIDINAPDLKILSDMPIGFGEPHYVQMISVDKLDPWYVYPVGTDPLTMGPSQHAISAGEERLERNGDEVTIWMTARRSTFTPDVIRLREGDKVTMHVTNIETARDATHGIAIPGYNLQASLDPGEVMSFEFVANRSGPFAFYCTEFCSALHLEMQGWILIEK